MKLVFIYGPPASGKLTVAKELSKITYFKLFHNHIINDAVANIFDIGKAEFWKLSDELKLKFIEYAAENRVSGLIFTNVYIKNKGELVEKIKNVVEKNKGKILFVKLECDKQELLRRVKNKSRRKHGKLCSSRDLEKFMKQNVVHTSLPFKKQLKINNTDLSPRKVAQIIKKHYEL